MNFVAAVAGFGLIGWWVDSTWDSSPWGVLIGVTLGLVGASYNLVRETTAAFKKPADKRELHGRDDRNHDAPS